MAILQSYYQDVYRSPVVRLSGYSGRHELASSILAYLDFGGATGTCKDGVAETMLAFATERGTLQPGMPVVEASSGSFGAALAVSCATTGHPCILVVPSSLPLSRRLYQIGTDMEALIGQLKPDVISIEELFFNTNLTTGIAVAHGRGVLLYAAEKCAVPLYEYTPGQVKLAVTGYGKAEKRQVMDMTRRLLKLKAVPRPDDAADALALALCHARSSTSRFPRCGDVKETI